MTAIILAGGKSRRMGSNKAFLEYGSTTFIEHQVMMLRKIFDEIILSADDANAYTSLKLPIVSDIIPGKGPLSGICAGLKRATSSHAFVIACDMPFINEKLILYLKSQINGYDVVVPKTSRGLEPMHAFYSRNCIQPMSRCLEEGRLRIIDFFSEVKVKIVDEKEFAGLDASMLSLINLNTPEEYKKYCNSLLPDLFIQNCGQLLTAAGASQRPKTLQGMNDLGIILDGAVAIKDGNIIDVGTTRQLGKRYNRKGVNIIDALGKVVLPGFVDCHTHAVFGGDRAGEFVQRIQGENYLEILKKGGGILSTVKNTRKLTLEKLVEVSKKHLDTMLLQGTTTAEIKSGYGLNKKDELKILKAIQYLQKTHPINIISTFLGGHTVPSEYKSNPNAYVDLICNMLQEVKPYATFCDVFCDEGGFDVQQSERILSTAKKLGFRLKIHVNEFKDIGGVPLAIRSCVISADHLDNIRHRDILKLKESGIICVLLPGVPFFLMKNNYAPGRKMIEEGLPIALATDFNPGTCPCENIQMIITLACLKLGMTPAQAINAVTINAAHALGMADRIGSIEVGKQADIIILDIQDYNQLPYYFGTNHVKNVLKKGRLIVENKQLVDLR